ncbi:MAG: histidine phosphatase family protein [Candidatus Binataceae bacterium]
MYHRGLPGAYGIDHPRALCFTARMPQLTVLLVRHATPVRPGTPGYEDHDRPLTAQGVEDAEKLAADHAASSIDGIYSSPYRRAFQTVEPVGARLGLTIEVIDDLRERFLMAAGVPDHEWRPLLERCWRDFDYAPPGGETGRTAQDRIIRVLDGIRSRHSGGIVMIGSHGNLIALALNAIDSRLGMDFFAAMPMPAVYRLESSGGGWRIISGPNVR